ncbi:MAG: hypothetical protein ACRDS0_13215 [Pseudonocardiaceae bacterium]
MISQSQAVEAAARMIVPAVRALRAWDRYRMVGSNGASHVKSLNGDVSYENAVLDSLTPP